ncbi:hypothetical protein TorRG33x02_271000 [Trema orientale]|uniref:Uncharacterized protein n=1 Tax=Trema orientale TaxID=63057 RepID=A0A2P5CWA1_TREOI|nr:hypothetical protein TorRG33x02_271000 [Trema orientale]
MAARKISDVGTIMKMNPNPYEKVVLAAKTELEKEIKPNPVEMNKKKEFKPKTGDVFPAKKRLVKTMIFKYIVKKCSVFFHGGSCSAKASKAHKGN